MVYYILSDSDNPSLRFFPNNAEVTKLANYLVSKGVLPKQSHICKCPVCCGKGFVPGNFYDAPGVSVSYSSYQNSQHTTTVCLSCSGSGIIRQEED
jgi:hypothetical protein